MLDWMVELLALPGRFLSTSATGGGVIQGSASEATLVAICSARWRATKGAVNRDGDTTRLVAYATAQSHSSVEKGLRIAGIGQVISLGDVFLAVGLGRFLEHELRRPRRYFKRGAHAQPGSASKT